jgi:glycine hydroxymethyltransferase
MRIAVGADHGGFEIKERVKRLLAARGVEVEDLGCHSKAAVDYPDYAREVALRVARGAADQGLLVCTTGIGMDMAANKFPGVRAALCLTPAMAATARTHNDANVLVLAEGITAPETADAIVERWLQNDFSRAERHARRVGKIAQFVLPDPCQEALRGEDPEVFEVVRQEEAHERETVNLIASENYVSPAVRAATGSVLTNKYAEGYPGKRWYNGCRWVDEAERLAVERARQLFGAEHVNVQPHCGSAANMAVYFATLKPGDTILAMSLDHGGHLTHGHKVNFSGRFFRVVSYGVRPDTERIDYDEVARAAGESRCRLIVAGASSYPRLLDFRRFREIADSVGAYLMVDMAHIAGLVAGGCHPSPVPEADFVTTTTHKTLRGPRSGMILCRARFAAEIDRQVFPGIQGGPQMHTIAAKAVCLHEALQPAFRDYAAQIVRNARALAGALQADGLRLVSGGTDNHLLLADLTSRNVTGREAAAALERAGIIVNKNVIPFDRQSAFLTSGIRLGTPAVTTRGMREADMQHLAGLILKVVADPLDDARVQQTRAPVRDLAARFPVT